MRAGLHPHVGPSGMVDDVSVPSHWCSPSFCRRLLPGAVGPSCRLGAGCEYPPLLAPLLPTPSHAHPIISPFQVLFCADLRKGQKPAGSQHQA